MAVSEDVLAILQPI